MEWRKDNSTKKMSLPNLAIEQGQIWGMGVRHTLFPVLTLGASSLGLPASRRYSPRQAEFIRPRSRAVQYPVFAEPLNY